MTSNENCPDYAHSPLYIVSRITPHALGSGSPPPPNQFEKSTPLTRLVASISEISTSIVAELKKSGSVIKRHLRISQNIQNLVALGIVRGAAVTVRTFRMTLNLTGLDLT